MNLRFLAQISLLFLLFMPSQANSDPEDYKEEAMRVLPCRPETFKELYEPFEPILHPEVKIKFEEYFQIMFQKDFPPPPPTHSDLMIANGFRCLYRKVADAHKNPNKEEEAKLQLAALYTTLAFHKVKIKEFNRALGKKITDFPCESCKASTAKVEFGIEEHEEY